MSSIVGAQVQIELEQLDKMRAELVSAKERVAQLETTLAGMSLHGQGSEKLAQALRDALKVVEFAVANLPPSDAPRWPHTHLRALAAFLRDTNYDPLLKEWSSVLLEFAAEAREWEIARKDGRVREMVARETGRPVPPPEAPVFSGQPVPVEND